MVIQEVLRAQWHEVKELPRSDREAGGFGHTGAIGKTDVVCKTDAVRKTDVVRKT
jgi:hypothetical protein